MAQLLAGILLTDEGPLGLVGCPSSMLLALGLDTGLLIPLFLDGGLLLLLHLLLRPLETVLGRVGRRG